MDCCLINTKPLPKPMLTYCQLDPEEQTSVTFENLNQNKAIVFQEKASQHTEAETKWLLFYRTRFKCIFLNENVWISIKISLKFIPNDPVNNIPAFVQIMAWHRLGDKPLSEPMVVTLPTHTCITQPQWVKWALKMFFFLFRRYDLNFS